MSCLSFRDVLVMPTSCQSSVPSSLFSLIRPSVVRPVVVVVLCPSRLVRPPSSSKGQALEYRLFRHIFRQQTNDRRVVDRVVAPFGARSNSVSRCIREGCRTGEQVCRGTNFPLSFLVALGDPWYLEGLCGKKVSCGHVYVAKWFQFSEFLRVAL